MTMSTIDHEHHRSIDPLSSTELCSDPPNSNSTTFHDLHKEVLKQIEHLKKERRGVIEIPLVVYSPLTHSSLSTPILTYETANLCEVIDKYKHFGKNVRIYIKPLKHILEQSKDSDSNNETEEKMIIRSLQMAGIYGGDRLASWGCRTHHKTQCNYQQAFYLRCQCSQIYQGKKLTKDRSALAITENYRQSTYTNDNRNKRPVAKAKHAQRRTSHATPRSIADPRCQFSLLVYQDAIGFFVFPTVHPYHQFHACRYILRMPSRLLHRKEKTIIKDLGTARAQSGVAVNHHYVRTSRIGMPTVLSPNQIRYLQTVSKSLFDDDNDASTKSSSSTDDLFSFLEESGASYVSLLHRVDQPDDSSSPKKKVLFNETCNGNILISDIDCSLESDVAREALDEASHDREVRGIQDNQEMMVGIAFTTPYQLRQFSLFPYVIHIDATADTNKEDRPLVIVGGKDSMGKMFPILFALLPSEKAWSYQWLFQTAMTSLLGQQNLLRVTTAVTDGDATEIIQLLSAVDKYFPQARRLRCHWHIVDRGWNKNVKQSLGGKSRRKRPKHMKGKPRQNTPSLTEDQKVARIIYRWMFSFAQPGHCITKEEYLISKSLLLEFLESNVVSTTMKEEFASSVETFLNENVFPHEDHFCFYLRRTLFHLEAYTNCGLEGVNNGFKNSSCPLAPTCRLDNSVKTIHMKTDVKAENNMIVLYEKATSNSLWSDSPTAPYVTDVCESMIVREWEKGDEWSPVHVQQGKWLVEYKNTNSHSADTGNISDDFSSDTEESGSPSHDIGPSGNSYGVIPKFARVYVVDIESQVLKCSCGNHERMGFPCRHIASVLKSYSCFRPIAQNGFPITSVKTFWLVSYYLYGLSDHPSHKEIRESMKSLTANDTPGVHVPFGLELPIMDSPDRIRSIEVKFSTDKIHSVLNYTPEEVRLAVSKHLDENIPGSFVPAGMSQVSHFADDNSDGEVEFDQQFEEDDAGCEHNLDNFETFTLMKHKYAHVCRLIDNSSDKKHYAKVLSDAIAKVHDQVLSSFPKEKNTGKRCSMNPAVSRKRKTHGTSHY